MYDVIIVGAGPAGLSAALILGRCRRRVLICDAGEPRNWAAHAMHGFLSRDGIPPREFLRISREQLRGYPELELQDVMVQDAMQVPGGFEVVTATGTRYASKKLLLATGLVDELPPIPGLNELYGQSVFHCPYCDGWEMRDAAIAVYGHGRAGCKMALEMKAWTQDVVLCSDGALGATEEDAGRLRRNGIPVYEERIREVVAQKGRLERIVFVSGQELPRSALFFSTSTRARSPLPERFGCRVTQEGDLPTGPHEETHVPGLFVAGDASAEMRLAIGAAAKGAEAAFQINQELLADSLL